MQVSNISSLSDFKYFNYDEEILQIGQEFIGIYTSARLCKKGVNEKTQKFPSETLIIFPCLKETVSLNF